MLVWRAVPETADASSEQQIFDMVSSWMDSLQVICYVT